MRRIERNGSIGGCSDEGSSAMTLDILLLSVTFSHLISSNIGTNRLSAVLDIAHAALCGGKLRT